MRTLMKVVMPVEPANEAIKDGTMPKTIQSLVEDLRPEASYFYTENGRRTALFVFDMKESFQLPGIAEPMFTALNAEVTVAPVMNLDDLKKGLESIKGRHLAGAGR